MADNNMVQFGYLKEHEIQIALDRNLLVSWSVIFTSDTKRIFLINDELKSIPITSKIPVFSSFDEALENVNSDKQYYNGQLISILEEDHYDAYVLNTKSSKLYPVPILDKSMFDYDKIVNTPIKNLKGTNEEPINISALSQGKYMVSGHFTTPDEKEINSVVGNLFIVESNVIKRITNKEIIDYDISGETVIVAKYITDQILKADGVLTESEIDKKLQALEIITKNDLEEYINSVFRDLIVEVVKEELNERIAEDADIEALFE